MNKLKHIVSCLVFLYTLLGHAYAQSDLDIKVKKAGAGPEFYYKGKPVAPHTSGLC
jgi:hypothetical protein